MPPSPLFVLAFLLLFNILHRRPPAALLVCRPGYGLTFTPTVPNVCTAWALRAHEQANLYATCCAHIHPLFAPHLFVHALQHLDALFDGKLYLAPLHKNVIKPFGPSDSDSRLHFCLLFLL